eukprot:3179785-Prymnesium_polylepis.2
MALSHASPRAAPPPAPPPRTRKDRKYKVYLGLAPNEDTPSAAEPTTPPFLDIAFARETWHMPGSKVTRPRRARITSQLCLHNVRWPHVFPQTQPICPWPPGVPWPQNRSPGLKRALNPFPRLQNVRLKTVPWPQNGAMASNTCPGLK